MFFSRFPHPVSFGGTLEMGRCFLPVDDTWTQYAQNCEEAYKDLETEQRKIIRRLAASACRQSEERQFAEGGYCVYASFFLSFFLSLTILSVLYK